ncbi:MAG: energy transducer TonB [Labilithrix sp.]|nr:energy transducer TonB [Labilithrix sp.]
MTALAARWSPDDERGGLLRWILPASVALHVVVFSWLPSARRVTAALPPPSTFELAEPPPPPPPAPPTTEPAPERAPLRTPSPARSVPASPSRAASEPAPASAAPFEAPMDFTSTVFSNAGPGLALGGGGGSRAAAPAASAPPVAARAVPAPPPLRVVPPSSLARRPRAPGLDLELERQYPAEARRSGISGTAVLRVRILPDGRIGEVRVQSESWVGFGPACERTVRGARWEPPIDRDGAPVATDITYTCRFEVRS